ncbi:MAG: DNA phosphorothioation-dependent restriction protein DptF [Bacteroidales bacterium]|nr:DNA phosphorothioation-dependent restriction protein DptF [Bacteroidales bacterium]
MFDTELKSLFMRLRQGDKQSVQDGQSFDSFEEYLHVPRAVEDQLLQIMSNIAADGGGIVFLVGSAGDGKSHLMSSVKRLNPELASTFRFHNDATESYSPLMTSIDTLRVALRDFSDEKIDNTTEKMVVAINLGKLSAFTEDDDVKQHFTVLASALSQVLGHPTCQPHEKVHYIDFSCQQIFELDTNESSDYPVSSTFLKTILSKITAPVSGNPFFEAYHNCISDGFDPVFTNYKILSIHSVQDAIVKLTIEAIVRFKLIVTPREFLDFICSIVVFKNLSGYKVKQNYFDAMLPTLLFEGGDNKILKAISHLDPIKSSSTEHDSELALLFTSSKVPEKYLSTSLNDIGIVEVINKFYENNGKDSGKLTKFLFRFDHLTKYHSESQTYILFLSNLRGFYKNDTATILKLYDLVDCAIPRHHGSYYDKQDLVPLNIQGSQYKLFATVSKEVNFKSSHFDVDHKNQFSTCIALDWIVKDEPLHLDIDYQLFEYLTTLSHGRLSLNFEGDKNHVFSRFIRALIKNSSSNKRVTILTENNEERVLSQVMGNLIKLS